MCSGAHHAGAVSTGTEAVVVDWNGTIVDDLDRAVTATNTVLELHALPALDVTGFRGAFRLPLTDFFARLGVDGSLVEATERWNLELQLLPTTLSPGALSLLNTCRSADIDLIVLSAAARGVVTTDADRLGISRLISRIIAPAQDKPRQLRRLRDSFDHLVYVGDTDSDIFAAHAAGVACVAYSGGYHLASDLRSARPDAMVADLAAVMDVVAAARLPGQQRRHLLLKDD